MLLPSLLLAAAAATAANAAAVSPRNDDGHASATTGAAREACESFSLPSAIPEGINATLDFARYYPAGALFNETDPNTSLSTTRFNAFCRVRVNITTSPTSQSISEVWLPDASEWNRRFLGTGNGASGGGFAWSDMGFGGINYGYAAHATNGGHSSAGSNTSWALGNPEALIDWNDRSMHQGTVLAKSVISSFYNTSDYLSIYGACSAGGRQGWIEAERYPEDYDAIITGAPAIDDVRQSASALYVNQKVMPVNGSTWFSNETWALVHQEVMRQCDELDGVKDNLLSNPLACHFRPASLACKPGQEPFMNGNRSAPACLTLEQLEVLRYVYEPWVDEGNEYVWAGFPPGSELGFLTGNFLADGGENGQDGQWFRYVVHNDTEWKASDISFESVKLGVSTVGPGNSANNPDISKFVARGGKLIHYVGWNDQYLSALESIRWYQTVDTYMSASTNYTTDDYLRLYIAPGMKHCNGGAGANAFGQPGSFVNVPPPSGEPEYNAMAALIKWYETDTAPTHFIGTSYHNNNASLGISYQRPICQWPKSPVFKGGEKRDWKKAEEWECRL
ncbi:hypothetical protein JCM6882_003222 [Rhodosporidiobolus microsporus]